MFENNFHLQVVLDPLEPTTMAQKILDIWIIQSKDITTHGAGPVRQIFPKNIGKLNSTQQLEPPISISIKMVCH